jgi:hypothetical protein
MPTPTPISTKSVTANFEQKIPTPSLNLILNPGFETGSDGKPNNWNPNEWGLEGPANFEWISDSSDVRTGRGSAKISSLTPNDASWQQVVPVERNQLYLLSGWLKPIDVNLADAWSAWSTGANLSLWGTFIRSSGLWGTNQWTQEKLFFCPNSDQITVAARLGFHFSLVKGTVLFDDIELKKLNPPPMGQYIVLCLIPDHLALLKDPNAWLQKLDEVYRSYADLMGQAPYSGQKIIIHEVPGYPGGLMVVEKNLILWYQDYVSEGLLAVNDQNDLSYGVVHELGHIFDSPELKEYYIGKGPIGGEHWANFKVTYAADTLSDKYPAVTLYQPAIGYVSLGEFPRKYFVEQFALPWIKSGRTDWHNMSEDTYTGLLYLLKEEIGWEPFKKTFRDISALAISPPSTDIEKIKLFVDLLSKNAGRNLRSKFQEWGFPID